MARFICLSFIFYWYRCSSPLIILTCIKICYGSFNLYKFYFLVASSFFPSDKIIDVALIISFGKNIKFKSILSKKVHILWFWVNSSLKKFKQISSIEE
jgi:hypothetical protein